MRMIDRMMRRVRKPERGFTLIELMVVVVVVAILAAVAYPSYVDSVRKSKRGAAKGDLTAVAQTMERCFTQNNTYLGCWAGGNVLTAPSNVSPQTGTVAYNLALGGVTRTAFTVTATPAGAQAIDTCGTLGLDQTGLKTPATAGCW